LYWLKKRFCAGKQLRSADSQSLCKTVNILQADVSLTAFHAPDVSSVDFRHVGENILRNSQSFAFLAHSQPEGAE
jgi:hypothetical protein